MDRVSVFFPERIGTISKNLYGMFVEHIGALVDGGIWVGEDSDIPNIHGIRKDLIEKLREIDAPVLRWGGCTNEVYDWRDGIGPREKRPVSMGASFRCTGKGQVNDFGTHEFVDFCRLCGAEPYITLNIAGGSPLDAFHWVEYCNMPYGISSLTKLRAENGSPEPFNIKYWSIGNENNEYGGMMNPEDYCAAYARVSSLGTSLWGDSKLIASGPTWSNIEYGRRFLHSFLDRGIGWTAKKLDGYSLHVYTFAYGHDTTFSKEEWYQSLSESIIMQRIIEETSSMLEEFDPNRKIGIYVDEWGHWTTLRTDEDRGHLPFFWQVGTMREAVVAAITLNIFNNNCNIVKMANLTGLINYIHSLFASEGKKMIVTPTYYVFKMMKEHHEAECIRTVCSSESKDGIERVFASASIKNGKSLITLVNTRYDEENDVILELHNCKYHENVEIEILAAEKPQACNSYENPDNVKPIKKTVSASGNELRLTLPPASVVCVRFDTDLDEELFDTPVIPPYERIKEREVGEGYALNLCRI